MKIIVHHLYQILHAEEEVQFHNVYRGVPIGYPGKIVEMGKRTVRFQTHPHQLYCMKMEGTTHIESNLLPDLVRAVALKVDMQSRSVMLGQFAFTDPDFNPHEDVRVEPREPLKLGLWYEEEQRFPAHLQAVSLHALTVHLDPEGKQPDRLHSGEMVQVRFGFSASPSEKRIVRLEGRIRRIRKAEQATCLDVQIFPDEEQQELLARYIARRQKEILSELRTLTRQMNEGIEAG